VEKEVREVGVGLPTLSPRVLALVYRAKGLRLGRLPRVMHALDDASAEALRGSLMTAGYRRVALALLADALRTMRGLRVDGAVLPSYRAHALALQSIQVYVPIAHAVGAAKVMWELEDLGFRELFPEAYGAVETWHCAMWARAKDLLAEAKMNLLEELYVDEELTRYVHHLSVTGRTKNLFSTFKKILRDNKRKEDVLDVVAMRVIIHLRPEFEHSPTIAAQTCLRVRHNIARLWPELPGRFKDYVSHPKPNGYRSVHTTVVLRPAASPLPAVPVEVQVRTAEMHRVAECGPAAHHLYKAGDGRSVVEDATEKSLENGALMLLGEPNESGGDVRD